MKILHLSTTDGVAGASRAAGRLHAGLLRLGHESVMLVANREGSAPDPTVRVHEQPGDLSAKIARRVRRWQIDRAGAHYRHTRPSNFITFWDARSKHTDLAQRLPPADVINLHWVAGFVDAEHFFGRTPPCVPLVWRLADMNPLTGGCSYAAGCPKFTARCGACPQLGSTDENDLSRQNWVRKDRALARLGPDDLHLVATSRWIAEQAQQSSLTGRFPVTIIPNGLDTNDFAPRDRRFARDLLDVPQDARVVLFVGHSVDNPTKGFPHLVKALEGIPRESRPLLMTVGGGRPRLDPAEFPQRHVGWVGDDRLLSCAYSAADVFVMPSLHESFGQTATESMACGTPVVGFATGGIRDTVRPGVTGQLVATGDAHALRRAILEVLDAPPEARASMSADCRRVAVAEYSLEVQANRYANLYQDLIERRNGQPRRGDR